MKESYFVFFLISNPTKLEKAISKGFIIAKCQNSFFFSEKKMQAEERILYLDVHLNLKTKSLTEHNF